VYDVANGDEADVAFLDGGDNGLSKSVLVGVLFAEVGESGGAFEFDGGCVGDFRGFWGLCRCFGGSIVFGTEHVGVCRFVFY
jgi:hypothetical protein